MPFRFQQVNMIPYLDDLFENRPQSVIFCTGLVLILILGVFDYFTGPEISFSVFYLVPVGISAWYGKKYYTLLIIGLAGAAWLFVDAVSGREYSHDWIIVWNTGVRVTFFSVTALLIFQLKGRLAFEESLADTDPLTGLANRRKFMEITEMELERCRRYKTTFTLACFDLDNFKSVNDTKGHDEGDLLLTTVAGIMHENTRKNDIAGRLGGDEFALLFSNTDFQASKIAVEKLVKCLAETMQQEEWPVTFSIGMVTFAHAPSNVRDVMKLADNLMYTVKKGGKARTAHVTWEPVSNAKPPAV